MEDANSTHSKSKEVEVLSRVAANHLFLAQYEPLRAVLLSLRNRNPDLALSILRTIVLKAGRFDGVLWSSTCRSSSHIAWMAVLDLLDFENLSSSIGGFDHDRLRLKIEFLLLAQTLCDAVEVKDAEVFHRLRLILELGLRGLDSDGDGREKNGSEGDLTLEMALSDLQGVILDQADVFDVLCWNIHTQVNSFPEATELTIIASGVLESSDLSRGEFEDLVKVQRTVQMTHLSALNEYIESGDLDRAISHIRYIHLDFGVDESEYRLALKYLIKEIWIQKGGYEEAHNSFQNKMLLVYKEALSANCIQFLHIIQAIQDELLTDEIEKYQHIVSDNVPIPFPLQNYLKALKLGCTTGLDNQNFQTMVAHSCMGDMYQYARLSGAHILESVMNCALSAVKREQLQEACDVLSLFPLLQPLVAAMGWDLLSGKTAMRKKLLLTLWTSKSQVLRLEESSFYGKQSDEMSCVDYLCDLLCFHLDVASFVVCVNSGHAWNSKDSLLFSRKQQITCEKAVYHSDPFVENFVLERLATQTPLRVLFDVVPGIKFQDAIDLISMQPINSSSLACKRLQDIELMHIRYALESAVLALGTMEKCVDYEKDDHYYEAMWLLKNLKNHLESVTNISRKVFTLSIIISLLHMDKININPTHCASSSSYSAAFEKPDLATSCEDGNTMVVSFTSLLLVILHCSLQTVEGEQVHALNSGAEDAGKQALKWRVTHIKCFIEDWNWRLSILQRLQPLSDRSWSWKEALAVLCAAPSNLLNLCMQRAKYDIGEEAVHRFSLPPEDKAVLELTEWVASAFRRALAEESVSRAAEVVSESFQELDFASLHRQLVPLVVVLLCIDVAVTSAKSAEMCSRLLNEARRTLSKIRPRGSPKMHSADWDQLKEIAVIFVIQRVLQHLNLLEQEKACSFQEIFTGEAVLSPFKEPIKQGQRQHTLAILHQMIDDAHKGKRQFLSGKLHNLSRVVVDEDLDSEKKKLSSLEKGVVLGLGLKLLIAKKTTLTSTEDSSLHADYNASDAEKMLLGPLHSKPSTYISAFIIYIATIGDIVDGIDTTHDFNFFSLVYEWPKDLLTRLVFERGSTDAAAQIADIMCSDFVHEIISACVPPVFPPQSSHGWASVPLICNLSNTTLDTISSKDARTSSTVAFPVPLDVPLYSLKLDIVKHLAKLSPVRAILACVFGSSILSSSWLSYITDRFNADLAQSPDIERMFYEFALDQSERFPTLNRWIQIQSNLRKVSESAIAATPDAKAQGKVSVKRSREPEGDAESEIDGIAGVSFVSAITGGDNAKDHAASNSCQESPKMVDIELDSTSFLSLDWENEGPYEMAVERLIREGKLMDALVISDRFLSNGASDHLLQLLIEDGEEIHFTPGQSPSYEAHNLCSNTWQYCLRLKDKQLSAKIALKYLRHWELNAALDVLNMCLCHLSQCDPIRNEIWKMRQDLKKYTHILSAEESHKSWRGVETEYKEDPEGMALRLAGKGAVSAALEVAESAVLSIDLRRELQGRQLVKLLTEDPLNGGGPAEASRFLSSLPDPDDALPVAMGAMQLLPDLHSKQLLVHLFLKRRSGNLSDVEISRLNSWALGLRVLAVLPLPWQQRCSALHEHPQLILEVLLMMKQLHYASVVLKEFPSMRDDNLILTYCGKAISVSVNSITRESRISGSGSGSRISQKPRSNILSAGLSNLQKEARRAFSWARDTENKASPKEAHRKRKSSIPMSSERVSWETMPGIQEEHNSVYSTNGQERVPFVPVAEEWVLTGDPNRDDIVRSSHKYQSSPDFVLFKGLLSLCSDELVSTRGALELCVSQMKSVLSSQQLPLHASMEAISQAYHATEAFVQALGYTKSQLKIIAGMSDLSSNLERSRGVDDASSSETGSSSMGSQYLDELSELQTQAEIWFRHAELLQSLLGSGIAASLNDIADEESSACLRDRLIKDERYSMAVYTCKKCKIDSFPVWNAWGHALIRMKNYAQARVKFKQALQLHKGDPSPIIREIINTMEGGPPVDVSTARSLYKNLVESVATILDDSLSADAYLNVLYMPRTEYADIPSQFSNSDYEDGPHSNLDDNRYVECIYYLQEFARPQMLPFMFQHGHYYDACMLFFPPNDVPSPTQHGTVSAFSIPQRTDPLATDYGTIENLCDFCIGYDAMTVLEDILSTRTSVSQDAATINYIASALIRICNYCETHRHFNFLYKFQVIREDNVAAGFCCIQLFMNSLSQEEAINHLSNAEMHFDEELSARSHETSKIVSSSFRGKSVSGRFSAEGIVKLITCLRHQVNVIKTFNDNEGPQWKHSLFGNPNDPETFRRRCRIAETLAEKNLDLVDGVIYNFNLPAVDIFAGVAATFAERKRSNLLTNLFTNIKSMIETDDLDQVLGAAINVYANKHKERPDKLIDMLSSSHRKVMACVVCGRLKSAFQIASRSGSVADVQYVAHQALHANAFPVLDMCKQWLAKYS